MDYRARLKKVIFMILPIITIGLIYAIYIEITGDGLDCIIYESIGIKCPGCGITRMCMNILHLNFYEAFVSNELLFVALPIGFVWLIYKVFIYVKTGNSSLSKTENICAYIFIVLVIVFCIIRNI